MNPLTIILAISLATNCALGYLYLGQRDTATVQTVKTEQATGAAVACTAGVEEVQKAAIIRHREAAPKIEAARQQAETHNKAADLILSTPAAVPGDDCKSAQARVDDWWGKEGGK